jgi:hypothetical protein
VTSSLTAESPTIQKLQNILGVDIGILATQIMRARKTRKRLSGAVILEARQSETFEDMHRNILILATFSPSLLVM